MIHPPVPPEVWGKEGARVADNLEDVAAALIVGSDSAASFAVAVGIARSQRDGRRVAIGDLVGDVGPDAELGLVECFRDGISITDIAHPITEDASVFVLPTGSAPVEEWLFESARWNALIAGFREVDALLLLIASPHSRGLERLASVVDGVVAVDLPPIQIRSWPLLATVDRPDDELPPIRATPRGTPASAPGSSRGFWSPRRAPLWAALAVVVAAAGYAYRTLPTANSPTANSPTANSPTADAVGTPTANAVRTPPANAVRTLPFSLNEIVNLSDSSFASIFSVELVAANTPAGANSIQASRGDLLPTVSVTPIPLGTDGRPWYRALTGAWTDRAEAQAFLDQMRERGLVKHEMGRVLRVPYALRLATGLHREDVSTAIIQWNARGIPAYALMQDNNRANIYAGAFETPGQAVLLAMSLSDLGIEPVVAFRTGRTF